VSSPQEDLIEARDALKALVNLKDGPRDAHYIEARGPAWERARAILKTIEVKEAALAEIERASQIRQSWFKRWVASRCGQLFYVDASERQVPCMRARFHEGAHSSRTIDEADGDSHEAIVAIEEEVERRYQNHDRPMKVETMPYEQGIENQKPEFLTPLTDSLAYRLRNRIKWRKDNNRPQCTVEVMVTKDGEPTGETVRCALAAAHQGPHYRDPDGE
jgi:hypothetical protein